MSNITNVDFTSLNASGENYLQWILHVELHLDAKGLGDAIKTGNKLPKNERSRAMIFMLHHLSPKLQDEYVSLRDPVELWTCLKDRHEHQKAVILPKARYDWIHLRLQDFKTVGEYNSAIFKITQRLKLCGKTITDADMHKKHSLLFTPQILFFNNNIVKKGFKKYSKLVSCLLVAEQNNELLMKNHESRPTGSAPFPEVNATSHNTFGHGSYRDHGNGRGRGYGRGRGCGQGRGRGRHNHFKNGYNKRAYNETEKNGDDGSTKRVRESTCHRCGMKDHWSRTCKVAKHLVDLYQASKARLKSIETNYVQDANEHGQFDVAHLGVADCFDPLEGGIGHMVFSENN